MALAIVIPGLLDLVDRLLDLDDLGSLVIAATLKRVVGHLPFLDAVLAVEMAFEKDITGAQPDQLTHQLVGQRKRRLGLVVRSMAHLEKDV